MAKSSKTDPYADREAQKYQRPIPSREYIMAILKERGIPMTWSEIADSLALEDEQDTTALIRRLRAMERDGQVIRNRREGYGLVDKMDLVRGYVTAHSDGFGFLIPDDGSDDLFLSAKQMRSVIHGDRIVAHISGIDRRGRREGSIVEILQRNTERVVGRYHREGGVGFVIPDNKRITHDIVIPVEYQGEAKQGQIVVAELIEQPNRRRQPIGRIAEILGEHMAPGMEIDVAIRAHDLPHEWSDVITEEAAAFGEMVDTSAIGDRVDLRELPLVTIDGVDARDFDDAVYCERNGKMWRLLVAIADVSHYVQTESAIDAEAQIRGNSVYFPGRVIPMLPEVLSNGLCSLNPDVDRMCMVCEMRVNESGTIKSYQFYDAIMRSSARLIYEDVAALLDGDKGLHSLYSHLVPHLENLNKVYKAFAGQRIKRGTIEFETTETFIEFGENKKIKNVLPRERNIAHKMIEECMIAANICAAKFLSKHQMPTLYRVHEIPDADKLTDLRAFLKSLGLKLQGGDQPQARHYAQLLNQVQGRPDAHLIQTVLLRSMKQAVYTPENIGHFGLALEKYAHFTSPIRRYPDLLVHRAIRHLTSGKGADNFYYSPDAMVKLGDQCSMTERRADDATRDVIAWLKCEYMTDRVGECFEGIITGVTSFGVFVELQGIYVEGLVHVTSLRNDYYHFDPIKHCLMGERTQQKFSLADRVEVRVVRVDLDEKRIDFDMISSGSDAGRKRGGKQSGKKLKSSRRSANKVKAEGRKKDKRGNKKDSKKSRSTTKSSGRKKSKKSLSKSKTAKSARKKSTTKSKQRKQKKK